MQDGYDKALGIRREESLEGLLKNSDCVSIHCNCAPDGSANAISRAISRAAPANYIDAAAFRQMKFGAFLVNTVSHAVFARPWRSKGRSQLSS